MVRVNECINTTINRVDGPRHAKTSLPIYVGSERSYQTDMSDQSSHYPLIESLATKEV